MSNRFNGTQAIVDIAGNAGATALLATGPVRFAKGVESTLTSAGVANVLQGFEYQLVTKNADGSVNLGPWILIATPSAESGDVADTVMEIGDPMSLRGPYGSIIGNGPQTYGQGLPPTAATTLCNLRSATATPTSVVVTQNY